MALADSQHECYSSMANRYWQTDHANKTWRELRADIESLIQNNRRGTSKDLDQFQDRNNRRIIIINSAAHYLSAHARLKIIAPNPTQVHKQTKYNTQRNTPHTPPFMQHSTDHSYIQPPPSSLQQSPSPNDSGYDSVFSTTSTDYK